MISVKNGTEELGWSSKKDRNWRCEDSSKQEMSITSGGIQVSLGTHTML